MKFRISKGLCRAMLFVLICSLFVGGIFGSVYAAEASSVCEAKQTGEKKITVEGWLTDGGAGYAIQVFAPLKSAEDLSSADEATNTEVIVFQEQGLTDEKGYYTHDFEIGEDGASGEYTVVFYSAETGLLTSAETFNFTLLSDFKEPAETLNEYAKAGDKSGFAKYAEDNTEVLAFFNGVFEIKDYTDVYEILYEDIREQPLDAADIPEATRRFMRACLISEKNDGNVDNVFSYKEYFDEEISSFIKYTDGDEALCKAVTKRIAECGSSEEFFNETAEALLLEKVKKHNGVSNLRAVMSDVESFCGIDPDDYSDDELLNASGVEYDSISDFESALGKSEKPVQRPSSGGSSGGGSGSSGGGGGGSTIVATQDTQANAPEEIGYDIYIDIDDVVWARNAIVTLSDMGILKGREALKFYPNDNVLREEFVKMIVLAFAEDAEEAELTFTDVDASQWYYPYIAKAKGAGLVTGYSDEVFGTGHNITREDLCVMAYNAYKSVKEAESAGAAAFKDADMISDYAVEAVAFLSEKGIVNGVDGEHFEPKANATRAQAAKIIYMLLDI